MQDNNVTYVGLEVITAVTEMWRRVTWYMFTDVS
jgi:hypothetical protein